MIFYKIYRFFIMPNTILWSIIGAVNLLRFAMKEVKSESDNEISNGKAIFKAAVRLQSDMESMDAYMDYLRDKIGFLKYIISALFWIALYRLIF